MAPGNDPYRALGLEPGATAAEIKRAYRRLAKAYHPDSAGERALPRFLAIQAAYERLSAGQPGAGGSTRGRRRARPRLSPRLELAAAARAARGARTPNVPGRRATRFDKRSTPAPAPDRGRPARRQWARPPDRDPPAAQPGPGGGAGPSGSAGAARPGRPGSGRRGRPKATIGSTSYDGTENEPFEPGWSGATWYGAASGTYWTINPKEYADPRKHGPEYLARARRSPKASGEPGPVPEAEPASADAHAADRPPAPPAPIRRSRVRGAGIGRARPNQRTLA